MRIHVSQRIRTSTGRLAGRRRGGQAEVLQIGHDDAVLGIWKADRAADERAAQVQRPGIAQPLQVNAEVVDSGAEAIEPADIDLHLAQQGTGRLLWITLAVLVEHCLPGLPIEFSQTASYIQPGAGRQIGRASPQTQLAAPLRPGTWRCSEGQCSECPVLHTVAPLSALQRHAQRGITAYTSRLAERCRQFDAQPL